jgi:hypothetical protein
MSNLLVLPFVLLSISRFPAHLISLTHPTSAHSHSLSPGALQQPHWLAPCFSAHALVGSTGDQRAHGAHTMLVQSAQEEPVAQVELSAMTVCDIVTSPPHIRLTRIIFARICAHCHCLTHTQQSRSAKEPTVSRP